MILSLGIAMTGALGKWLKLLLVRIPNCSNNSFLLTLVSLVSFTSLKVFLCALLDSPRTETPRGSWLAAYVPDGTTGGGEVRWGEPIAKNVYFDDRINRKPLTWDQYMILSSDSSCELAKHAGSTYVSFWGNRWGRVFMQGCTILSYLQYYISVLKFYIFIGSRLFRP
jgi:hypothetical protein